LKALLPLQGFLVTVTGLLVPFLKQSRVFPVQGEDCRETEDNKPDAEDPAFGPGNISGKGLGENTIPNIT
jgi:hypothetical protein